MCDRIYAFLLRLYPARFRRDYGHEMLQLCRDRCRDETGLYRKARLCCDLLLDAAIGLHRAWRHSCAAAASPSLAAADPAAAPLFRLLDKQPLRPGAVLIGSTISFAVLIAFGAVMNLPPAFRAVSRFSKPSAIESVLERVNRAAAQESSDQAAATAGSPAAASASQSAQNSSTVSVASAPKLDDAERSRVIHSVADNLVAHYYDRDLAQKASADLLSLQQRGYYNAIVDGQTLATRLSFELQRDTQDRHLRIEFTRNIIPNGPPPSPSAAVTDQYRALMQRENCTFEKVEILPGNIGYLKLNSFPNPSACAATARSALARINHSDAVIFDLRDNTGGFPEMVATMAAPLFNRPVRWYNPREGDGSHWLSPASGSSLADKPVYILTSAITLSGAEQFTYNLKMLNRATVIGDTTGGGAHVGVFHRLDDHFGMGIPETRINNPYGKPDWEGTGVEPDIKVAPADALSTAEQLARDRRRK